MTDWRRVEEVFAEALGLPAAERAGYLDRVCSSDPSLRAEVWSLLTAENQTPTTFLNEPLTLSSGFSSGLAAPPPPGPGEHVGPYRLVEKIGAGGMGTVYLAERADGAFQRKVAVKVLRRGLEDEPTLLRFDLERRILAGLDHPGIARLLDGGTTPAGSPFVVMELVDGQPIDRYCEARGLSVAARIDLFLEVCTAVAAAHRRLVVHRDIKPSNVWVDREGRPKLLDFGIAKILDPDPTLDRGKTTASWQRLLTPSHASPEQLRGEAITVATDVYLLGILLYQLLTARLPHHFPSRSLAEAERILTHETPTAPSRILRLATSGPVEATPPGVKAIDTDLDHIVLAALRPDPAERYGSVPELADDLRRFRAGLPIHARVGSLRYRLKKQVQRHWRALTGTGLGLILLTSFAVDRALQVERRERALGRAETYLARSEALSDFFEKLFWNANPRAAKGQQLTVAEALARGEARLLRSGLGNAGLEAEAYALFGKIRLDLGDYPMARSDLERALERFETISEPDDALRLVALEARGNLALVRLFQVDSPDDEGAEQELAAAITDAQHVYRESRSLQSSDPARALELSSPLAEIYCQLERWQEAAPLTAEAIALVRRVENPRSLPVAQALGRRALILKNLDGDFPAARALYTEALDIFLDLEGAVHPEVANLHNQLGLVAEESGDLQTAVAAHEAALEARRKLYPEGHGTIRQSLAHLGRLLHRQGERARAIETYHQLIEVSRQLYGPTGGWTVKHTLELSQILLEDCRLANAEDLLRGLLTPEQRSARPAGSRLIVQAQGLLGAARWAQGDPSGEPMLRRSLHSLQEHPTGYEGEIQWLEAALEEKIVCS